MDYKKPLTLDKQIELIELHKRVVFKDVTKEDAKDYLLLNNYINVVSPFKYKYAKLSGPRGMTQEAIKLQVDPSVRRHHYEVEKDFKFYVDCHTAERADYGTIMNGIIKFETAFKSMTIYYLFTNYKSENTTDLVNTIKALNQRVNKSQLDYSFNDKKVEETEKRKRHIRRSFDKIIDDLQGASTSYPFCDGNEVKNIYTYFDRLSLKVIINIFLGLKFELQEEIFNKMKKQKLALNCIELNSFKSKIFNLVSIRDCIAHCNSLEILLLFSNTDMGEFRSLSSRKSYESLLNAVKSIS